MGVCTVTPVKTWHEGDVKVVVADVAPSTSYATGGETLGTTEFNLLGELRQVQVPAVSVAGDRLFTYDAANSKMLIFTAIGTEAANASNQSTKTVRVTARGKGAAVV